MKLLEKIKSIIRQSIITLITDDTEQYPRMQVNYNGKTAYAIRVSPYGLCSNPPNGILSLLMNVNGNESQKFGIPIDLVNRFKGLKEGEVVLYNSATQKYIYLKEDGTIEIVGDAAWAGNLTITGNLVVTGTVTATDFDTGTITLNTHVHGGVTTGGGVTAVGQ